jgi:hypothetical protein
VEEEAQKQDKRMKNWESNSEEEEDSRSDEEEDSEE